MLTIKTLFRVIYIIVIIFIIINAGSQNFNERSNTRFNIKKFTLSINQANQFNQIISYTTGNIKSRNFKKTEFRIGLMKSLVLTNDETEKKLRTKRNISENIYVNKRFYRQKLKNKRINEENREKILKKVQVKRKNTSRYKGQRKLRKITINLVLDNPQKNKNETKIEILIKRKTQKSKLRNTHTKARVKNKKMKSNMSKIKEENQDETKVKNAIKEKISSSHAWTEKKADNLSQKNSSKVFRNQEKFKIHSKNRKKVITLGTAKRDLSQKKNTKTLLSQLTAEDIENQNRSEEYSSQTLESVKCNNKVLKTSKILKFSQSSSKNGETISQVSKNNTQLISKTDKCKDKSQIGQKENKSKESEIKKIKKLLKEREVKFFKSKTRTFFHKSKKIKAKSILHVSESDNYSESNIQLTESTLQEVNTDNSTNETAISETDDFTHESSNNGETSNTLSTNDENVTENESPNITPTLENTQRTTISDGATETSFDNKYSYKTFESSKESETSLTDNSLSTNDEQTFKEKSIEKNTQPKSITESGTSESNTSESGTSESNTSESNTSESGTSESNTSESNTSESGTSESNTSESNTSESGTSESGTSESNTSESGTSESGTSESNTSESGISESSTSESSISETFVSIQVSSFSTSQKQSDTPNVGATTHHIHNATKTTKSSQSIICFRSIYLWRTNLLSRVYQLRVYLYKYIFIISRRKYFTRNLYCRYIKLLKKIYSNLLNDYFWYRCPERLKIKRLLRLEQIFLFIGQNIANNNKNNDWTVKTCQYGNIRFYCSISLSVAT